MKLSLINPLSNTLSSLNPFGRLFRSLHISYVLLKYGMDEIVLATPFFRPLRFLILFSPSRYLGKHQKPRGERIRQALEELGPIFVKFGQVLSTRVDILPEDIIQELSRLQDRVPPFCGELARKLVEKDLGQPISIYFKEFDEIPLASASIAQVHRAMMLCGKEVVIKVLRPNIHKAIKRDVDLLKSIAKHCSRYWKRSRQFKPKEIVAEFEKSLIDELDLMREAANASQLRRNFQNSTLLYIPEIHWPLTKNNIMVMERIHGIPLHNVPVLVQQGFNPKQLAEMMVEVFFTQVFRDCFFHADMHPGNLFADLQNPKTPKIIAVDFGIMGSLGPTDQRYLAENFLAFFKRDYRRVAELHKESAWVPSFVRVDEFEASIRAVCEPIFERPLKEISFGTLLLRLFQTASRFHVEIQPQLILLQKTLLNVEGLGRRLYPDLDIFTTARPILEKWMKTQIGMSATLRKIKLHAPYWLEKLPDIPNLLYAALSNASDKQYAEMKKLHETQIHLIRKKNFYRDMLFGMLLGICFGMLLMYLYTYYGYNSF